MIDALHGLHCMPDRDTIKQNTEKCFGLVIRPDFDCSLSAVTQGSSVADTELHEQRGDSRNGLGMERQRRDMLLPKCVFLFSFRASIIKTNLISPYGLYKCLVICKSL